jgi:hypothetical protein
MSVGENDNTHWRISGPASDRRPITPADLARAASQANVSPSQLQATPSSPSTNPIFFTAPAYGSGGRDADSVAVGDVNGDGKPDLVVTNQCADNTCVNGSVSVLLGNGDGTFQAAVSYGSGGQYSFSVAVGDVNGDGKPDLIVANQCVSNNNCANGSVSVLLGNGDGTFKGAVSYGSGGVYAQSVAVGDVNADGHPDLVVANQCVSNNNCANGEVSVLLGNGDGTFQAAVSYGSGGYGASFVGVGDVNGDGKPDLGGGERVRQQQQLRERRGQCAAGEWRWNLPGGGKLWVGRAVPRVGVGGGCERGRQTGPGGGKPVRHLQQLRERRLGRRATGERRWDVPGGGELWVGRAGPLVGGVCASSRKLSGLHFDFGERQTSIELNSLIAELTRLCDNRGQLSQGRSSGRGVGNVLSGALNTGCGDGSSPADFGILALSREDPRALHRLFRCRCLTLRDHRAGEDAPSLNLIVTSFFVLKSFDDLSRRRFLLDKGTPLLQGQICNSEARLGNAELVACGGPQGQGLLLHLMGARKIRLLHQQTS